MSDNNKPPQDALRESIKKAVDTANSGLQQMQTTLETWKKPMSAALQTAEENGGIVLDSVKTLYKRRHEFAPEIIGGTGAVTGGYFWLRRGRFAGLLAGAASAGMAYAVVYDEFSLEDIPNVIFGNKK
jgi:hypothetical protein